LLLNEIQAKQLFSCDESDNKKQYISASSDKKNVIWIIGGNKVDLVGSAVAKILENYKENNNSVYTTIDKNSVENVIRLITVEWKEKGHSFN